MRITNKIMQNNSLNNVNYNKLMQDKYNTQMSTQKKINRPSDDPVVAIRALRLRNNVSEVSQYYEKNIPDAESWLSVTEGALGNVVEVIKSMYTQCTKGSSGELTTEDRQIILESLKALREEVYATGDADYAGRYVFTGYRTDTSLMFPEKMEREYSITEQLDKNVIDDLMFTKTTSAVGTHDLYDMNGTNYEQMNITEQDVEAFEVHRIRLSYSDLKQGTPKIEYVDDQGKPQKIQITESKKSYDLPSPYETIHEQGSGDKVIFVPDTGEILLGQNVYDKLMGTKDDLGTNDVNEGEIRVIYEKNNWNKGDLRPEHYFACTAKEDGKPIEYNKDYLTSNKGTTQIIEYDVGFNQSIRVNSTADECFKHGVGREVDDLIRALENTIEIEKTVGELESVLKANEGTSKEAEIQKKLDAVNKAYALLKDSTQKLFEHGITTMQGYLDEANLSVTNNGTRGKKLVLIENRMQTQKTTFETLKSENEDVDIADATIKLTSAQLVYEASLMATSKVMKNTLLDFI